MKKTIALCASVTFYKELLEIRDKLKKMGFGVVVPELALFMEKIKEFEFEKIKVEYYGNNFSKRKGEEMRKHFKKIEKAQAILVINNKKHGVDRYIGPNVFLEIGLAFYFGKKIFILNPVEKSAFMEEILAMEPVWLNGDLSKIEL